MMLGRVCHAVPWRRLASASLQPINPVLCGKVIPGGVVSQEQHARGTPPRGCACFATASSPLLIRREKLHSHLQMQPRSGMGYKAPPHPGKSELAALTSRTCLPMLMNALSFSEFAGVVVLPRDAHHYHCDKGMSICKHWEWQVHGSSGCPSGSSAGLFMLFQVRRSLQNTSPGNPFSNFQESLGIYWTFQVTLPRKLGGTLCQLGYDPSAEEPPQEHAQIQMLETDDEGWSFKAAVGQESRINQVHVLPIARIASPRLGLARRHSLPTRI
eukprot:1150502-Pelagomonas_calceolata.AAC.7